MFKNVYFTCYPMLKIHSFFAQTFASNKNLPTLRLDNRKVETFVPILFGVNPILSHIMDEKEMFMKTPSKLAWNLIVKDLTSYLKIFHFHRSGCLHQFLFQSPKLTYCILSPTIDGLLYTTMRPILCKVQCEFFSK